MKIHSNCKGMFTNCTYKDCQFTHRHMNSPLIISFLFCISNLKMTLEVKNRVLIQVKSRNKIFKYQGVKN
jgi:hypothetical protein